MTEVGGQSGQECLDVFALTIPLEQAGTGTAVTKIVQARSRATLSSAETTLGQDMPEREVGVGVIDPTARAGKKQGVSRGRGSRAGALADVALKDGCGRR